MFIEDYHARYFVTSAKHDKKKLDEEGLKCRGIVGGKHSKCNSTMQLYMYSKAKRDNAKAPTKNDIRVNKKIASKRSYGISPAGSKIHTYSLVPSTC